MKKFVLTFGLISGGVASAIMSLSCYLLNGEHIDYEKGEIVGYSAMVLSFLFIFFGIRAYRENVGGGSITFGRAFKVGILITIISSLCYVITWQIIYFNFMPDFLDKYATHQVERMRESGKSAEDIAAYEKRMATMRQLYQNPLFNAAITLVEPFPVGLILTLVSAGILRKKPGARDGDPAVATA